MQARSSSPGTARDKKNGSLSKHAILNNALHTHANQNPPPRIRRPRPRLRRQRAYAEFKEESSEPQDIRQEALLSDNDCRVQSYKQNIERHSIMPAALLFPSADPFAQALQLVRSELSSNAGDIGEFCGAHAHPAALIDAKHYKTAPRLCQIIADLLQKLRLEEGLPSATTVVLMWLHWSLWTWLIAPSVDTYTRLPDIMRPTLSQVSIPHDLAVDFIPSPSLRDSFCQRQPNRDWPLSSLFQAAFCYGPKNTLCSLGKEPNTQALDVTPECKAYARVSKNWSFDAAVEPTITDDLLTTEKMGIVSEHVHDQQ